MQHVYLIRHCQAEGQPPEAPLTELGTLQAERLPSFFADRPLNAVVSSPFLRAQLTAEPLARAFGLPVRVDERLMERVLSKEPLEDWRLALQQTYDDGKLRFEGGESAEEAAARGLACLREQTLSKAQHVAIVTHGNLLSLLIRQFQHDFGYDAWSVMTNPDVYYLTHEHEVWTYQGRIWPGLGTC